MTEKQIQTSIINYLNTYGCYVWNVNAGKIRIETKRGVRYFQGAPTGHSDVQGIHKKTGRFIAIEVKTPERRKNTTHAQDQFLKQMFEAGAITGVATSAEEALAIVEAATR